MTTSQIEKANFEALRFIIMYVIEGKSWGSHWWIIISIQGFDVM